MNTDLTGKVALVTGASRGIGRAIALGFARAGVQVVVAGRKQAGVDAVAEEIRQLGGAALGIAAHVGDEESIHALVEKALAAFGRIDVLVNNAATNPHSGPLLWCSREAGKACAGCQGVMIPCRRAPRSPPLPMAKAGSDPDTLQASRKRLLRSAHRCV